MNQAKLDEARLKYFILEVFKACIPSGNKILKREVGTLEKVQLNRSSSGCLQLKVKK